jgi:hypothetical protein
MLGREEKCSQIFGRTTWKEWPIRLMKNVKINPRKYNWEF